MPKTDFINHSNDSKANTNTIALGLPDLNNRKVKVKLPILLSCRIRLSDEQRALLKGAYHRLRNQHIPEAKSMPGSTVSSTVQVNPDAMLGLNSIVMADLLGSRDSIPLETILRIQKVLGVEAVTRDDVSAAADSYLDWMFVGKFDNE